MNVDAILKKYHINTPEEFDTACTTQPTIMDELYDALYLEIPYSTAKARDGDPQEWIVEYCYRILEE